MIEFPKCMSFIIENNPHRFHYTTVQGFIDQIDNGIILGPYMFWVSDEEKLKAIKNDEMWSLQFYPDTPLGSYMIYASSFEALLEGWKSLEFEP